MVSAKQLRHLARNLRRNQTDAELRLWRTLRSRQIQGEKFRRQYPLDKYILDFVCLEEKLVVEVDGSQHQDQAHEDGLRTRFLESKGLSVLRFNNLEVLANIEGVVFTIVESVAPAET